MTRVAFLAHCLLNQNAKTLGGAKRPGMWEPVIDLLTERGWTIRQMPCPAAYETRSQTRAAAALGPGPGASRLAALSRL